MESKIVRFKYLRATGLQQKREISVNILFHEKVSTSVQGVKMMLVFLRIGLQVVVLSIFMSPSSGTICEEAARETKKLKFS